MAERGGERASCCERRKSQRGEAGRVFAQVDDLPRVPLVAEDQRREEGQRDQHRRRSSSARRQQDRGSGGTGGEQQAHRGEDVAQPDLPSRWQLGVGRGRASCSFMTPPGTRVRSCPRSLTRSL